MYFLIPRQHLNEFLDTRGTGLGLLRRLHSKQDGIAICAIQRLKKPLRLRVFVQFTLQIVRDGNLALRGISRVPASIGLRQLNLSLNC